MPADLANKYYSDEVEEGMTAAVGAAGAQAAVDAAQGCADEAQTALDKARGSMLELEGKRKRSGADDILLAMLKGNMPLMEAGLNACTQALVTAKAAAAKAAAAKGCKQSRPAAKKAKR